MQVMANGRVRRNESEWRDVITGWRKSGLSAREFCQKHELQIASFHRWAQRYNGTRPEVISDFVPVTGAAASVPAPTPWKLEIALPNGITLRFQG